MAPLTVEACVAGEVMIAAGVTMCVAVVKDADTKPGTARAMVVKFAAVESRCPETDPGDVNSAAVVTTPERSPLSETKHPC